MERPGSPEEAIHAQNLGRRGLKSNRPKAYAKENLTIFLSTKSIRRRICL